MKKLKAHSLTMAAGMFLGVIGLVVVPSQTMAAGWKCSAANLKNYSYSGGSKAMIHLRAYNKGGRYSVKKINSKKVKGKTKDGTPFTCVKT